MAAYAALVSLMNTIDHIQNHPRLSTCLHTKQVESPCEKVYFLLDFIENTRSHGLFTSKEAEVLESQVASAANAAEDVIESHIVDLIHSQGRTEKRSVSALDLHEVIEDRTTSSIKETMEDNKGKGKVIKLMHSMRTLFSRKKVAKERDPIRQEVVEVKEERGFDDVSESLVVEQVPLGSVSFVDLEATIQDMDYIKKKVLEFKEESGSKDLHPAYLMMPTNIPPTPFTNDDKNAMVGFDEQLIELMDKLTGQPSGRQIISVVGMGGIGKTTLAKTAYEHSLIVQYFHIRTWVTISQTYSVREIFLQLLSCESKSPNEVNQETDEQLGERLYKKLSGWRYLIVLDDIWSVEAWHKVKAFFPSNKNGSRIVVTTRMANLGVHFDSSCLELTFLDEDKSWKLFCETTFGGVGCPPELEDTGREICKKCKGLPISIVVIGRLLGRSHMMQEYWKNIAKDLVSILNARENNLDCFNILSLSYTHLPPHLKPCFLYMGTFPEDHDIHVSQLVKLWVAEGFIKSNKTRSSEEIASSYLDDLIDRNLILKHSLGSNGKIRTCKVHDLLRDLCLKIAEKENFICMTKDIPPDIETQRRIVLSEVHPTFGPTLRSTAPAARTLVLHKHRGPLPFDNRLLRIFNVFYDENTDLTKEVFDQVNLRCLRLRYGTLSFFSGELPSSISLLWNLQTLIILKGTIHAPSQIWEMRQLRHMDICRLYLPDPPPSDQHGDGFVLINLQTVKLVTNFRWSEEVCKRVLNVEKLNVAYNQSGKSLNDYCFYNLGGLQKLKSLKCTFDRTRNTSGLLQNLTTLTSLRKLTLELCEVHWEDLTMIGTLPHLEVLKLKWRSVKGPVWNPVEGEFLRLKFLLIRGTDLVYWNAAGSHFPVLEKLLLQGMGELDEIPLDVGEIPTLRLIDLYRCSESAAISALKIAEEQENAGNEELQVRVRFEAKEQVDSFWERVGIESFTSNNFHASYSFLTLRAITVPTFNFS